MNLTDGALRAINEKDLDIILEWRNSDRVRNTMFSDRYITIDEHYAWFESFQQSSDLHLLFEFRNKPAGICNFTDVDKYNNRCSWGFYVGETKMPRGTGLLLGYCSLEYAFDSNRIRKLCTSVLSKNLISINYHKKLGFAEEGILLKHVKKENMYEDVICFAQFNNEWQSYRKEIVKQLEKLY